MSAWPHLLTAISLLFVLSCGSPLDVLSSVGNLEKLMTEEWSLVEKLEKYLDVTQRHLESVRRFIAEYQKFKLDKSTTSEITGDPIQAYQLIKRLFVQWQDLETKVGQTEAEESWKDIMADKSTMPDLEDFVGAATSIMFLQDTYDLNVTHFTDGRIQIENQTAYTSAAIFSAQDCLLIGKQAFQRGLYDRAVEWLEVALLQTGREDSGHGAWTEVQTLLEKVIRKHDETLESEGPFGETWRTFPMPINPSRTLETNTTRAEDRPLEQRNATDAAKESRVWHWERNRTKVYTPQLFEYVSVHEELETFHLLCRGQRIRPPEIDADLQCYYVDNGDPYLLIGPFKLEEKSLDPYISIFHDFVYEEEMKLLQDLALPHMVTSTSLQDDGKFRESEDRVSKQSWIEDSEHETVQQLSKRISWATGLETGEGATETYQVARYGVGGYYVPHIDHSDEDDVNLTDEDDSEMDERLGNRLATFMMYLEDVAAGGATVFPQIGVTVWPIKGSAILWWNLRRSGEGDDFTRHGGCPILHGVKWISTKWIRSHAQMFKFPCSPDQLEKFAPEF